MQFAGRFGLTIPPETQAICREQDLAELPRERIWEEVKKLMLRSPHPAHGWAYAEDLGVLKILPELAALKALEPQGRAGPWSRMLLALDAVATLSASEAADRLVLCLAALCHELGRTATGSPDAPLDVTLAAAAEGPTGALLERLTNEVGITKAVVPLIRELPRVQTLWERRDTHPEPDIRRLALRAPIHLLLLLAQARHAAELGDVCGAESPAIAWLRQEAGRLGVLRQAPEPLLKGRHLLERGFRPGPEMGETLHRAFEHQLDGEFATVEGALEWLQRRRAGTAGAPA
jgi:tRNA nucleotidyltransferase (CCA-adding enzyme)